MKHKTLSQTTFLTARSLLLQLVSTHQGPFSSKAVINVVLVMIDTHPYVDFKSRKFILEIIYNCNNKQGQLSNGQNCKVKLNNVKIKFLFNSPEIILPMFVFLRVIWLVLEIFHQSCIVSITPPSPKYWYSSIFLRNQECGAEEFSPFLRSHHSDLAW